MSRPFGSGLLVSGFWFLGFGVRFGLQLGLTRRLGLRFLFVGLGLGFSLPLGVTPRRRLDLMLGPRLGLRFRLGIDFSPHP